VFHHGDVLGAAKLVPQLHQAGKSDEKIISDLNLDFEVIN
jgi:hypothetical protein